MALLDPQNKLAQVEWQTRQKIQELAQAFARATGMHMRVRSARRTCAEQAEQVRMGFSHASGCHSWHVVGRAVDLDILKADGSPVRVSEPYAAAGAIWERMGGRWGGRIIIQGYPDEGHFEWRPGLTIGQVCNANLTCEQASQRIDVRGPFLQGSMLQAGLMGAVLMVVGHWLWTRQSAVNRAPRMAGR